MSRKPFGIFYCLRMMRVYQPQRISYLLALTAFIAFFSLSASVAETNTQYYITQSAYNTNAYVTNNTVTNSSSYYIPQAQTTFQASPSYYYPPARLPDVASSSLPGFLNLAGSASEYYYPSLIPATPLPYRQLSSAQSSGALPALSQVGYYFPGSSSYSYSSITSNNSNSNFGNSFSNNNNNLSYNLSYSFPSGSYYFPSGSYSSSTAYGSSYSSSYSAPGSSYYIPGNSSYNISSTGYYIPDTRFASGGSSGFSIPSQAASFSSYSPSGYSGFYNGALSPFTPFFTNSQFSAPAYLNGISVSMPAVGRRASAPVASLVMANATRGMYCWDPLGWLNAGFQLGIWDKNLPIRAQTLDPDGFLLPVAPAFTVQTTGQTGSMVLFRSDLQLFEGQAEGPGSGDYLITASAGAASVTTVAHRRNTSCDLCHSTPPGHTAAPGTWGKCSICHNLGSVVHIHAYRANIAIDDCYRCHPVGCLTGVHGQTGLWCVDCHGNLLDAENRQMLIPGQLGMPHCADCHDPLHAENLPSIFMDSAGHGGIWCINCHEPTHTENPLPLGYNNCTLCHTTQAGLSWMGPNCQACHSSSVSPHLVTP